MEITILSENNLDEYLNFTQKYNVAEMADPLGTALYTHYISNVLHNLRFIILAVKRHLHRNKEIPFYWPIFQGRTAPNLYVYMQDVNNIQVQSVHREPYSRTFEEIRFSIPLYPEPTHA